MYSDDLVSLSLLVRADSLQDEPDDEMNEMYEGLITTIIEKRRKRGCSPKISSLPKAAGSIPRSGFLNSEMVGVSGASSADKTRLR
jgi:hypothetical protein